MSTEDKFLPTFSRFSWDIKEAEFEKVKNINWKETIPKIILNNLQNEK